jgi:polyisoprenoid-binding protein YceI
VGKALHNIVLHSVAKFAVMAGVVVLLAIRSFGQDDSWEINSGQSTAQFSVASSKNSGSAVDLAVAMAAGTIRLDRSNLSDSRFRLSIFPAGQAASLLLPNGTFRDGALAALPMYTLLSFCSHSAVLTADGKIAFIGELSARHVQREEDVAWSNSYSGPVPDEISVNTLAREVTFVVDLPRPVANTNHEVRAFEIEAMANVDRNNFRGLLSDLRQSSWPVVVLNERCEMPSYPALTARDYSGPVCSGTPIETRPLPEPHYSYAPNDIGTRADIPLSGNRLVILAHLHLHAARSRNIGDH